MTPSYLLALLRSSGFRVSANEGTLIVSPASKLFPEDVAEVRSHKEALLALLASEEAEHHYTTSQELWP